MSDSAESFLADPPDLLRPLIRRGRITVLPAGPYWRAGGTVS